MLRIHTVIHVLKSPSMQDHLEDLNVDTTSKPIVRSVVDYSSVIRDFLRGDF